MSGSTPGGEDGCCPTCGTAPANRWLVWPVGWPVIGWAVGTMTFWQENYGFVKEVYDFRCSKYLEWMDNIEAIIGKVMANTQYTAKEFKIIKDTFTVGTECVESCT
ncbi:hypothetical protein E2C01_102218 [Portunus trituberculatus]|uniref:Uncharacterized protein n=1 Tax=Portunus trituberculatus TaxID=210409 RepID=A0A5B7KHS6_PORTR|nr:hypothetical protein [Portunus trituberculatus]